MTYTQSYNSPLGRIVLASREDALIGLWFESQKYFGRTLCEEVVEKETSILREAHRWLDLYFSGHRPDFVPPLRLLGTPFQQQVWQHLLAIPYGATTTYAQLALACHTSARAIGGAVGRNPISLIVPCHRVVASDGSLTGYAGGTDRKKALLEMEQCLIG